VSEKFVLVGMLLSTLMFATSSCRHRKPFAFISSIFSMAAAGQGRRHDHETTIDHALMRGLITAGPDTSRSFLGLVSSVGLEPADSTGEGSPGRDRASSLAQLWICCCYAMSSVKGLLRAYATWPVSVWRLPRQNPRAPERLRR
jgi:hypothetical protein